MERGNAGRFYSISVDVVTLKIMDETYSRGSFHNSTFRPSYMISLHFYFLQTQILGRNVKVSNTKVRTPRNYLAYRFARLATQPNF